MRKLSLLMILLLAACYSKQRSGQVVILHTNDMHAQFLPAPATWVQGSPKPLIGGMEALDYFVRRQREEHPNAVLLLDAGDFTTGTLLSRIVYNGVYNGGFVEMMNLVGYQAVTLGNHEFDEGQENLLRTLELLQADVLTSNWKMRGKRPRMLYRIYRVGGLRVGVIGLLMSDLASVTAEKHLDGVRIEPPATAAQRLIDRIDGKTDLIVLLTHQGIENDIELARSVRRADVIVGGHSHSLLRKPLRENGVLIVQTGSSLRAMGKLTLDVAGDSVSAWNYELINLWADSVRGVNPPMRALVERFSGEINAQYGEVIGRLETDWLSSGGGETNLGNFVADVIRSATQAEIAFMNSGGIRKSLPAGPIRLLDIWEILPFSNYLVTFELTGDQLLRIITADVNEHLQKGGGLLQISGMSYTFQRTPEGTGEVTELRIGGEPVDPSRTYRAATVDFI
ncbi:MAG: bifunctional metallophosphatase/5'-nucleotidase, partial [candidate division KSB1 bacterium]|nr:bifunctional metallophosphatase/5'-nucleotidase [candidate division KSB1 bacterium]